MPVYEFKCDRCSFSFEKTLSIKAARPKQCPKCRSRKEFYQVISEPMVFVKGNITTFGQKVEADRKAAGKELCQKFDEAEAKQPRYRKGKFSGKIPEGGKLVPKEEYTGGDWHNEGQGTLDLKKVPNVDKYIMEGKTL